MLKKTLHQLRCHLFSPSGLAILLVLGFFAIIPHLPAQFQHLAGLSRALAAENTNSSFLQGATEIFNALLLIIYHVLFWPVISLIGALMDTDFVTGDQIISVLRNTWMQVRDLMNIAFVFILLGMALVTVLGIEELEERLSIKKTLPRVVAAIILINFSFFFAKIAIDGVNVLTTAVYAIPNSSVIRNINPNQNTDPIYTLAGIYEPKKEEDSKKSKINYCNLNSQAWDCDKLFQTCEEKNLGNCEARHTACVVNRDTNNRQLLKVIKENSKESQTSELVTFNPDGTVTFTDRNVMQMEQEHIVCVLPLVESTTLTETANGTSGNLTDKGVAFAMARDLSQIMNSDFYNEKAFNNNGFLSMGIAYLLQIFLFIATFFAYLALLIALLIRTVILWVLIALAPAIIVQKIVFSGKGEDYFGMFISHLLIPLKVAVAITIAYIFANSFSGLFSEMPSIADIFNFIKDEKENTGLIVPDKSNASVLQHILYAVMAVGILWVGVFSAFRGTKAEGITDKIKGAGQWVMKTPKYIPLPVPGIKGGLSVAQGLAAKDLAKHSFLDMTVTSPLKDKFPALAGGSAAAIAATTHKKHEFLLKLMQDKNVAHDFAGLSNAKREETFKEAGLNTSHPGFDASAFASKDSQKIKDQIDRLIKHNDIKTEDLKNNNATSITQAYLKHNESSTTPTSSATPPITQSDLTGRAIVPTAIIGTLAAYDDKIKEADTVAANTSDSDEKRTAEKQKEDYIDKRNQAITATINQNITSLDPKNKNDKSEIDALAKAFENLNAKQTTKILTDLTPEKLTDFFQKIQPEQKKDILEKIQDTPNLESLAEKLEIDTEKIKTDNSGDADKIKEALRTAITEKTSATPT